MQQTLQYLDAINTFYSELNRSAASTMLLQTLLFVTVEVPKQLCPVATS